MAPFDHELTLGIFQMYQSEKMGENSFCKSCKEWADKKNKPISSPALPVHHIGSEYSQQEKRLIEIC